jgi:hypothetical protein
LAASSRSSADGVARVLSAGGAAAASSPTPQ